jgi:hypothetical protein
VSGAEWKIGDLAICVGKGRWFDVAQRNLRTGPQPGSIHEVDEIGEMDGLVYLGFSAWPEDFFESPAFRKIEPLTEWEHGRFEIELMSNARRQREVAQ